MDVVVHVNNTEYFMFGDVTELNDARIVDKNHIPSSCAPPLYQNVYFLHYTQHVLSALADMLFDIAVLEFICSQLESLLCEGVATWYLLLHKELVSRNCCSSIWSIIIIGR